MVLIRHCPDPVSDENTNKIMEQMKNYICRIFLDEIGYGTGFFCFIYYKNKKMPVMMTNNHILNERILKRDKISVEINKEEKNIYLTNKKIYTSKNYDVTIIEINPEKDCIYNFLELDENLFIEKDLEKQYLDSSIYILQTDLDYNFASYGIIRDISEEKKSFKYLCSTTRCSGGAPIMNLRNLKIIGIHYGCNSNYTYNLGTIINHPINEFINKYKDYLETIIESPKAFSFGNNENKIKDETNGNNFKKIISELEFSLKKVKEKNREIEEQIKKL